MNLGKMVKKFRNNSGLTLLQASEKIGICPSYLSQIEHGHKRISKVSTLKLIANFLGVDFHDIIQ